MAPAGAGEWQDEKQGWKGERAGAGMWVIDCSPVPDKAECGTGALGRQLGNPGKEKEGCTRLPPAPVPPPSSHHNAGLQQYRTLNKYLD